MRPSPLGSGSLRPGGSSNAMLVGELSQRVDDAIEALNRPSNRTRMQAPTPKRRALQLAMGEAVKIAQHRRHRMHGTRPGADHSCRLEEPPRAARPRPHALRPRI